MNKKFKMAALTLSACMALGVVCFTACEGTPGKSAYDIWLEQGNTGTEQDFLDSLKGAQGNPGTPGTPGTPGNPGTPGTPGAAGKSAYQAWLDAGNTGTEQQFLESLKGEQGNDGNKIYHGEGDPNALDLAAEENDMYVDTASWHVYFFEDGEWQDYGTIKGGGEENEPAGIAVDIQADGEQEINVELTEGIHIIKADLGEATLTTGKLQAQIGDIISQLDLSAAKTAAAGAGHNIYFGYVVVPADTQTIKIMAKTEAVKASISFEDYVEPTLSAGSTVEVPVNYQNTAEPIRIRLSDEVKNSTAYNITVKCTTDALVMNMFVNSDSSFAAFFMSQTYGTAQALTFTTLQSTDNTLYFTVPGLTTVVYAATVQLELAS